MTYIEKQVLDLLVAYPQMMREIKLLRYELEHPAVISPEEMLEAMSFSRADQGSGHPSGSVSDKTNSIALSYREKAERMNMDVSQEILSHLWQLEHEIGRLEYVVSLLEERQQMIIRLRYFEGLQWDAICEQTSLSIRTLRNVKNAAVTALAGLYDLIE